MVVDDDLRAQKASKKDVVFRNLAASRVKNNNNNSQNKAEKQIYPHHNQHVVIFMHKNISGESS